jgi:hypothetical protein
MQHLKTPKPASAAHAEPVSNLEWLGNHSSTQPLTHRQARIRCELVGSDVVVAGDIKADGAFDLCRRLLAAGASPAAELVCFRDGRLALRIRSIGDGARLTVRETATDGPRFTTWRPFPAARSGHPFVKNATPSIPNPNSVSDARGVAASPIGAAVDRVIDHGGADGC